MACKQRKEALAALNRANKEYKEGCESPKDKYTELDQESASSIELISDVEALVESVRRRPWSFKAVKMKIAIAAVRQRGHKDIRRNNLSSVGVNNRGCISSPVHLHDLTGLVIQMHSGIGLGGIVPVVLLELG